MDYQKQIQWISKGKQIGVSLTFEKNGEPCWSSVAVQKWNDVVQVYFYEILESQMAAENFIKDELHKFSSIEEALEYISKNTEATPEELAPLKGTKIFVPE